MSLCSDTKKYCVLMETSAEDHESWLFFIRYTDNETALTHLNDQLNKIEDKVVLDDIHLFDLDIENLVSESTAKEMTMLELNSRTYHRKFDGEMQIIDFKFDKRDSDDKKLWKVYDKIGDGDIDQFITNEDVPEGAREMSDSSSSSEEEEEEKKSKRMIVEKIPKSLMNA